jgi:hypothetical protein
MPESKLFIVIALVVIFGIVIQIYRVIRRRKKDYREIIEPMLKERGYELISSVPAGMLDTGPFPRVEFTTGRPQTRTPVGRGEYTEYRIVTFADTQGNRYKAWVKLNFEMFQFAHAEWKPDLSELSSSDTHTDT